MITRPAFDYSYQILEVNVTNLNYGLELKTKQAK